MNSRSREIMFRLFRLRIREKESLLACVGCWHFACCAVCFRAAVFARRKVGETTITDVVVAAAASEGQSEQGLGLGGKARKSLTQVGNSRAAGRVDLREKEEDTQRSSYMCVCVCLAFIKCPYKEHNFAR